MKIAILNCLNHNTRCAGAACLNAMNRRIRSFECYKDTELELVAMGRCNGCEAGMDAGMQEKLERFVQEGAEVVHFGICTKNKEGAECPLISRSAEYLEQHGVKVVRGTH